MDKAMGWQAMGKPDFSEVGRLFYRLPAELRESLNRSEEKVLIWMLFFVWTKAYHSGRNTAYATVSEKAVAERLRRSRWTVMRAIKRLTSLSLLISKRRFSGKTDCWVTNIFSLGSRLSAILRLSLPKKVNKSACSKTAPQEVGNDYKRDQAASFESPPPVPEEGTGQCLKKAKELFAQWSHLIPTPT